jgi:hypothetical protein
MTDAQDQALDKVHDILKEHFTGSVVVVECEIDDKLESVNCLYAGGFAKSLGLLKVGESRIWNDRRQLERDHE